MKTSFFYLKKFLNSEWLRVIALVIVSIYTYYPFITGANLGFEDAKWYLHILADGIEQLQHFIFPVYVGQGIHNYFGTEMIRAPYYIFFSQAIYLLSFGKLSYLSIQHLTIIFSAIIAALVCYFLLTKLNPRYRWAAFAFTFFYISCPGIMGTIYEYDMYYSFMTIPFIPLLIYGLIRLQQNTDVSATLIIAASLSLLLLAHPPIALWCMVVTLIFYLSRPLNISTLKNFCIMLGAFALLSCWQLTSLRSLKLDSEYFPLRHDYLTVMINQLRRQVPDVFYPLGVIHHADMQILQLGYALWFCVILGIIMSFRRKRESIRMDSRLRGNDILLIAIFVLLIFLYPPPIIGEFLWQQLPQIVINITYLWPMERFYYILAALAGFLGYLAYCYLAQSSRTKKIMNCFIILLLAWNVYQINFFIQIKQYYASKNNLTRSWLSMDSTYFSHDHVEPAHLTLFSGNYDPILKNTILDAQKNVIPSLSNEAFLTHKCLTENPKVMSEQSQQLIHGYMLPLFNFKIDPFTKYFICVSAEFPRHPKPNYFLFQVASSGYTTTFSPPLIQDNSPPVSEVLTTVLYTSNPNGAIQHAVLDIEKNNLPRVKSYNWITYTNDSLPINVNSIFPFGAMVNLPQAGYIEIFKEYFDGYKAKVNNKNVEVLESPRHLIMIPLVQGLNNIQLNFQGTIGMRIAFLVSLITWFCLSLFFTNIVPRRIQ